MAAPKKRDFDLFAGLAAADRRDWDWLGRQSEAARQDFSPLVFMRWASTIADGPDAAVALLAVNEAVNVHFWDLAEHPELLFKLTALAGTDTRQRHKWFPMAHRRRVSDAARDLVAHFHPGAKDDEIDLLLRLHTAESFAEFVDDTGIQADDAKASKAAFAKRGATST